MQYIWYIWYIYIISIYPTESNFALMETDLSVQYNVLK